LWLGGTSYQQLGTTEQGIVTTFGKYSRTIGPGASFTLPWPIQSVDVEAVTQTQRDKIPDGDEEKLMLTSDQNLIDLSYQIRWNIKDLKLYKFRLSDPQDTVKEVAEAAMRASVAEVSLNGVMGGTGRADVEQKVRSRMQAVLDAYKSGVRVLGVEIKKSDPPDKVNAAFQQVSVAQQDAQRAISNAQAYAQQLTAQAQGAAAEFDKVYEQYKLAPGVTRRRIYYETMERVLSNNEKVIVEANGVTPYLPLPQVRQKPQEPTITVQGGQ
jgi:modulator of FtsH protease HflK